MTIPIKLLQAIGDPSNLPADQPVDVEFEATDDPILSAILSNNNVDPALRSILREDDRRRRKRDRLEFEIDKLEAKDEDPEGAGIISFLGPVPVGFQLGTALGIEGDWLRLAVDIIADPVNLIAGVGALTKLGRAAKLLKGLSANDKANELIRGTKFLANTLADPEEAILLQQALKQHKFKEVFKRSRALGKSVSKRKMKILEKQGHEDLVKLLRNERETKRGLRAAFSLKDKEKSIEEVSGFLNKIRTGQRGIVNFGNPIPFVGGEWGAVTLPGIIEDFKNLKNVPAAFKGVAANFSEGVNPANSLESFNLLKTKLDDTIDVANGSSLVKTYGSDDWAKTGENFGVVVQSQAYEMERLSTELDAAVRGVFDPETRVKVTRFLDDPRSSRSKKFFNSLSPDQQRSVIEMQGYLDKLGEVGVEEQVLKDLLDNYVPRIIKFKKAGLEDIFKNEIVKTLKRSPSEITTEAPRELATEGVTKSVFRGRKKGKLPGNKHSLSRVFLTIKDAEDFLKKNPDAFEFKTLDIAQILREYTKSVGTAIVRNRAIKTALDGKTVEGLPMALKAGDITSKAELRGLENLYQGVDNPSFEGFVFHKDISKDMQNVFNKRFLDMANPRSTITQKAIHALDKFNSGAKSAMFNLLPFFHGMSLIQSNFALLPFGTAVRTTADVTKFMFAQFRKDREGAYNILNNMMSRSFRGKNGETILDGADLMREMRGSLLKQGRIHDAEGIKVWEGILNGLEKAIPKPLNSPITGGKWLNERFDRSLWAFLQDGMKMQAWVHMRQAEILRDPSLLTSASRRFKLNNEIAQIVNQSFGGLAWERLGSNPNFTDAMRWLLVAPDWTISNLLMARDMFVNMPGVREIIRPGRGTALTRDILLPDVRFRWAMGYNLRAAFYYYGFGNLLNRAFTGRWLWENGKDSFDEDVGLNTRIELPYKRADGRGQFMDILKQFVEPLKVVRNPTEFYTSKMGVLPRTFKATVVGIDSFNRPVYGTEDGPYLKLMKSIAEGAGQFAPIPLQQGAAVYQGFRDPRTFAISTFGGVNIRSENKESFERSQRIELLKRELAGTR